MRSIYGPAKRGLDIIGASTGLVLLSPILLACAILVKLTSPGPVLFRHSRVGWRGRAFDVLKFRTMVQGPPGRQVTAADDKRITRAGRVLRRYKLDELPQLFNVVRGEMSLVGPRPEVARYVARFPVEFERILSVRPGITDFAAIEYRDEERLLAQSEDPEAAYVNTVLPAKIRLYERYLREASLSTDVRLIIRTMGVILR